MSIWGTVGRVAKLVPAIVVAAEALVKVVAKAVKPTKKTEKKDD